MGLRAPRLMFSRIGAGAPRPRLSAGRSAFGAQAEDLEDMMSDLESVRGRDLTHPVLARRVDLDGGAATLADEVMVVLGLRAGAEELGLGDRDRIGVAAVCERIELSVDGGQADACAFVFEATVELFGGDEASLGFQGGADEGLLRGAARLLLRSCHEESSLVVPAKAHMHERAYTREIMKHVTINGRFAP